MFIPLYNFAFLNKDLNQLITVEFKIKYETLRWGRGGKEAKVK